MPCWASAGTDRQFPQLLHHTLMVGTCYKRFIKDVSARRRLPETYSTYIHAPSRTEPGMAPEGGDSIAILLPVPNLKSGDTWDSELTDEIAGAVVRDLETSFGVEGLAAATVVEHRMTPADFRDRLGAVDGNAFAIEPTLHQSAAFRVPNRHPKVRGVYAVGGGSHPGAGVPGVLFGAEVTAGLIARDHPRAAGPVRRGPHALVGSAANPKARS